jgi:type I restriction enzyme S subunit
MNRYAEYRSPRLAWLPPIPAHWDEKRARFLVRERDERSSSGSEELLSVSHLTGVTPRSEKQVTMFEAETTVGHKLVQAGDLAVNTMWAWMGALGVSDYEGVVSPSYAVYEPQDSSTFAARYLDRLLRTPPYITEYRRRSRGVRSSRLRLYPDQFLDIPILTPPLDEQNAIVSFLQAKDIQVGQLIKNKLRTIEVLDERKRSIIAHATTSGIGRPVPSKSSGLPWQVAVPHHWRKLHLAGDVKVVNGYAFDSTKFSLEAGVPLVRIRDIFSATTQVCYDGPWLEEAAIDTGDVLIGMDGDFNVAVWRGGPALLNQRVCCVRPIGDALIREYLALALVQPLRWINSQTFSTTVKHLSSGDIQRIRLYAPDVEEQAAIVAAVQSQTRSIDIATDRQQREIQLLREYRERLTFDVVTGQIEVRNAPQPPADDIETQALEVRRLLDAGTAGEPDIELAGDEVPA